MLNNLIKLYWIEEKRLDKFVFDLPNVYFHYRMKKLFNKEINRRYLFSERDIIKVEMFIAIVPFPRHDSKPNLKLPNWRTTEFIKFWNRSSAIRFNRLVADSYTYARSRKKKDIDTLNRELKNLLNRFALKRKKIQFTVYPQKVHCSRTIRILRKTPRNRLKQVPRETVSFYVIEKSTGNLIKRNAIAGLRTDESRCCARSTARFSTFGIYRDIFVTRWWYNKIRNVAFITPRWKPCIYVSEQLVCGTRSETGSCRLLEEDRFKPWRSRNSRETVISSLF